MENLPAKRSDFLLYTGNDGKVAVEVFLKDETVWLTQKAMAELFGVIAPAINKHLSNIFGGEELEKEATISTLETVQKEGKRRVKRKLEVYNLDAIVSVGNRVNTYRATQFRIWGRGAGSIAAGFTRCKAWENSLFCRRRSADHYPTIGCLCKRNHKTPHRS